MTKNINMLKAAKARHDFRQGGGAVTHCPPGEAYGAGPISFRAHRSTQHAGLMRSVQRAYWGPGVRRNNPQAWTVANKRP